MKFSLQAQKVLKVAATKKPPKKAKPKGAKSHAAFNLPPEHLVSFDRVHTYHHLFFTPLVVSNLCHATSASDIHFLFCVLLLMLVV